MDEAILRAFNAAMDVRVLAWIAIFLSSPWMLLATCGPLAVALIRKKRWAAIVTIALAMGSADAITARIVKPTVGRERPCRELEGLIKPVSCGVGKSFPSGHATVAFAFAVTAAPAIRFGWILFPILAVLVALSRVALGVHYPTDISAGAILGASIGAVALALSRAPSRLRRDPRATSARADPPP